ncbi:Plexin-B [Amphibalanus amphitrite]|uniref:Plexin-B n=1 Tax=Amphibalanus amphitrite TaxID=1232801 RepID=A0A6A4XEU0_AMPAM|nr:Plexin-B [Amphibalanus amphitrite]
MTYVPDPLVLPFTDGRRAYTGEPLLVRGENLNLAADASDASVTVGDQPCNVTSLALRQLVCVPPTDASGPQEVQVGALVLAAATLVAGVLYRRRSTAASQQFKRVQQQMNNMENNVRTECKQAFAELQTDMSDLTSALEHGRVIIHEHKTYVLNVLFPGAPDHPVGKDTLPVGFTVGVKTAMAQFEQLLTNRNFLLMLLEALESQKTFSSRDSVSVASLLTAVLLPRMEYLTSIVAGLLLRGRPATPRTLTRRSDTTLLERLLTCWLSVCLYEELREGGPAGRLLLLVRALHRLTERGPVDALTGAARYSLAESTLLKEQVDYKTVVVHASLNSNPSTLTCAALSCDTISQVKQKIIDRIFSSSADSHKPAPQDFDLEWLNGRGGRLTLSDTDLSSVTLHGWRRVNTLSHYGLEETARLALVARHSDEYTNYSEPYSNPVTHIYATPELTLPSSSAGYASGASSGCEPQPAQIYHLSRSASAGTTKKDELKQPIPEIYLTRLISTKGTVHKYIEDLFSALLSARHLPAPVRWLFSLLDAPPPPEPDGQPARRTAADVAQSRAWKAGVYGVRVWAALLRHPWTVYDVRRSQSFDASVAVVADTFVEALLPEGPGPHRDLSAERLLFVKDMERYRAAAAKFFSDVQLEPAVSDQEMSGLLQHLSGRHAAMLCTPVAAQELFTYVTRHWPAVRRAAAATDPVLLAKLESIHYAYHGQETSFSN